MWPGTKHPTSVLSLGFLSCKKRKATYFIKFSGYKEIRWDKTHRTFDPVASQLVRGTITCLHCNSIIYNILMFIMNIHNTLYLWIYSLKIIYFHIINKYNTYNVRYIYIERDIWDNVVSNYLFFFFSNYHFNPGYFWEEFLRWINTSINCDSR